MLLNGSTIVIENSWLERFFSLPTVRSPCPFSFIKLFVRFWRTPYARAIIILSLASSLLLSLNFLLTNNAWYGNGSPITLCMFFLTREPLTGKWTSRWLTLFESLEANPLDGKSNVDLSLSLRSSVSLTLSCVLCRLAGTWREIVGQDAWWYDYLSGLGSRNEKTGGVARLQTRDSTMHTRVCRCRCQIASVAGSTRRTCEKLPQSTQPVPQVPV